MSQAIDDNNTPFKSKSKPWTCGDPYRFTIPKPTKNHWELAYEKTEKWDTEQCHGWKDEIEKLLIFTGLFSAMVTGFLIEACKLLQDPNDTNTKILTRISNQMANQTQTPDFEFPPFTLTAASVRINIFWFLSFVISLSAVVMSILCLQWIRMYERDLTNRSAKEAMALRQLRMEAFYAWKVPDIVNFLPILLQTAVVLFTIGLYEFLWQINRTVAIATLIPISLVLAFLFFTTIIPGIQWSLVHLGVFHECAWLSPGTHTTMVTRLLAFPSCAYRSPQAWLVHQVTKLLWEQLGDRILGLLYCFVYSILFLLCCAIYFISVKPLERFTESEVHFKSFLRLVYNPNENLRNNRMYLFYYPPDIKSWVDADGLRRRALQMRVEDYASDSALARSIGWFRNTLCQSELNFQVLYHCFSDMSAATILEAARALPPAKFDGKPLLTLFGTSDTIEPYNQNQRRDWVHLHLFCWGAKHDLVQPLFPLFESLVRLKNSGYITEIPSCHFMLKSAVEEPFDSRDKMDLLLQLAQEPFGSNILKKGGICRYWECAIYLHRILKRSGFEKEKFYQDELGLRNFMKKDKSGIDLAFKDTVDELYGLLYETVSFAEHTPTLLSDPEFIDMAWEIVTRCEQREEGVLWLSIRKLESILPLANPEEPPAPVIDSVNEASRISVLLLRLYYFSLRIFLTLSILPPNSL